MKLERIVLLLSSLAIIGSFFLPYLNVDTLLGKVELSGYTLVQTGLDVAEVTEMPGGNALLKFVGDAWKETADAKDMGTLAAFVFVLLGPLFFVLFGIGYLIRALLGRQYKRGIFFTLVYVAASWAIFKWLGASYGIEEGFFSLVGLGFWVAFGGMLTSAFSLFFAKNLE